MHAGLTVLPGLARPRARRHTPNSPHSFTSATGCPATWRLCILSRRGQGRETPGLGLASRRCCRQFLLPWQTQLTPNPRASGRGAGVAAPSVGSQPKPPRFSPASCFSGSLLLQGFPRAKAAHFPASPTHGMGLGGSSSCSLPSSSSSAGSVQPALRKALSPKMGIFNLNQGVGGS